MSATTLSIKEIKFKMAMETLREVSPTLYQAIADYIKKEEPVCYEPGQSCPSCHTGTLVLRDKSAKPFIGCSNYKSGCRFSASCTEEQAKLTESLPQQEAEIQRLKEAVSNTAAFLDKAKRYTDIQALTPELLRLFIQKIVVHEKEVKWSKYAPQTVEIHYADIGCMENRQTAKPEQHKEIPKVS